ncbi:hypothetical protein F5880DRAFT_1586830 [Lentinula raphanica]|nr:hypothetical protein F5880DRAFT_1586830 [Lentinula raphanica]
MTLVQRTEVTDSYNYTYYYHALDAAQLWLVSISKFRVRPCSHRLRVTGRRSQHSKLLLQCFLHLPALILYLLHPNIRIRNLTCLSSSFPRSPCCVHPYSADSLDTLIPSFVPSRARVQVFFESSFAVHDMRFISSGPDFVLNLVSNAQNCPMLENSEKSWCSRSNPVSDFVPPFSFWGVRARPSRKLKHSSYQFEPASCIYSELQYHLNPATRSYPLTS